MTPRKKEEYLITVMNKRTEEVIYQGSDRRSILPNEADTRMQLITVVIGIVITALLGTLGYCGDIAYKGIMEFEQKIYTKMSIGKANRDNQFQWVEQECCANAKNPPPSLLPQ